MHYEIGILKPEEIDQLLALQEQNLQENLSTTAAQKEGFLTFRYSREIIEVMMKAMPQPVARAGGNIIAYALAFDKKRSLTVEIVKSFAELCEELEYEGELMRNAEYYLMGQICVSAGWRSIGISGALYKKHKELFSKDFDYMLTEVDSNNLPSLKAHSKAGFKKICEYLQGDKSWQLVALRLKTKMVGGVQSLV